MKYSIVNGKRSQPFKGGQGVCICCKAETIAKCGSKNIDHWAHKSLKQCDPWWENETQWHRNWKNYFSEEYQEIVHFDELTGEKHVADVKIPTGLVIEFQNSPISEDELQSREKFYKNMIWIVNGTEFKKNFSISGKLPNPESDFMEDIVFFARNQKLQSDVIGFYRKSENEEDSTMKRVHSLQDIENEIELNFVNHYSFEWKKSRYVWFKAQCRVLIDFDDEFIWELQKYGNQGLRCLRKIDKKIIKERAAIA